MPYPASPNFARVEMFFEGQSKVWSNILWFTETVNFPPSWNIVTFAAAFETYCKTQVLDVLSPLCKYLGANVLVHNAGLARSTDTYHTDVGTYATTPSDPMPDDIAVVVSRLSNTPGKSGRGRLYFAGIPYKFVEENRLSSIGVSQFGLLTDVLKTAISDQTIIWSPAIFSRKTTAFHAATEWQAENVLGTQRHRKARR